MAGPGGPSLTRKRLIGRHFSCRSSLSSLSRPTSYVGRGGDGRLRLTGRRRLASFSPFRCRAVTLAPSYKSIRRLGHRKGYLSELDF